MPLCDCNLCVDTIEETIVPVSFRRSTTFSSSDVQQADAATLKERGFQRIAPVVITCEAGYAKNQVVSLQPSAFEWDEHEWQLGEELAALDLVVAAGGIRIRQRGGALTIAATSEDEPVWVGLDARQQGPGIASCAADDEFLVGMNRLRILSTPAAAATVAAPAPAAFKKPARRESRSMRFSTTDPRAMEDAPIAKRVSIAVANALDKNPRMSQMSRRLSHVAQAVQASAESLSQTIGRKVRFLSRTNTTEYIRAGSGMRSLLGATESEQPLRPERTPFHKACKLDHARPSLGGTEPSTHSDAVLRVALTRPFRRAAEQEDADARIWQPASPPARRRRMREFHAKDTARYDSLYRVAKPIIGMAHQSAPVNAGRSSVTPRISYGLLTKTASTGTLPPSLVASASLDLLLGDEEDVDEELALRDGDALALDPNGFLVRVPGAQSAWETGEVPPTALTGLRVVARVRFHGHRFWLHEETDEAEVGEVVQRMLTTQAGSLTTTPAVVSVRAPTTADLGDGMNLPMGGCFMLGHSSFRILQPPPEARTMDQWGSLAVGLSKARIKSVGEHVPTDYRRLPRWQWMNAGTIGRRNNKNASLPIPDIKVKRRHAVFRLEGYKAGVTKTLDVSGLWLQPWKGKPCRLLIGRHDHNPSHPWRLRLGDTFCIGHSNIRFAQATRPTRKALALSERAVGGQDASPGVEEGREEGEVVVDGVGTGGLVLMQDHRYANVHPTNALVLMQDLGKRYRRKANKEKRRARKLKLIGSSSSEDDKEDGDGSDEEGPLGEATSPFVRLEIVDGPWRGRAFPLEQTRITIGSSQYCSLRLPTDLTVEEIHAAVHYVGGEWLLTDLGSRSGTALLIPDDGAQLDAGDVVTFGCTEVAFYMQNKAAPGGPQDDPAVERTALELPEPTEKTPIFVEDEGTGD